MQSVLLLIWNNDMFEALSYNIHWICSVRLDGETRNYFVHLASESNSKLRGIRI